MRNILLNLFFLVPFFISAQSKYDFNWIYGGDIAPDQIHQEGTIINFNTNPISLDYQLFSMKIGVSNAIISDEDGNLLFYTNGCFIADASHEMMMNGDSINPGEVHDIQCDIGYTAGAQSCMILPAPDSSHLYYLIHKRIIYDNGVIPNTLFYTLVDMNFNEGLGAVVEKNQAILNDTMIYGEMSAVKHANGRDWWIVSQKEHSNKYFTFLLTAEGFEGPFEQSIGIANNPNGGGSGQTNFTPDGSMFVRYNPYDGIYLLDFDRGTGLFSNFRNIWIGDEMTVGGVAVSSSSRYLYASSRLFIYQFDLEAGDVFDIMASQLTVAEYDGFVADFATTFYQAQLAPDCRIYLNTTNGDNILHVIKYPDRAGLACEVVQHGIHMPADHRFSMPYFPNYRLDTDEPYCDSTLQVPIVVTATEQPYVYEQVLAVYPNPAKDRFFVEVDSWFNKSYNMVLVNLLGEEVLRRRVDESITEVEVRNLPSGIYYLSLVENRQIIETHKVVINR